MGSNSDQVSRSTRVLANCRPSPPSSIPSLPSSTIATIESKLLAKFGRRNLDVVDVKKYLNNNGSNSGRKNKGGSGKGGKPWDWKNEGESEGNNLGWSDGANGDDDWKDIEDDDENIKEYYDEDDEGYEGIKEERKKGNGGEWEEELEGVLGGGGGIFGRKKSSGRDTQIKAKSGKDSDDVVVEGNEVKSKIKELKKKPKPEVKPIMIDCKGRDMILNIPYATKCIEEEAERSRMGEGIGFQIPSPTWESVGMNDGELRDKIVALGYGKPLQCQTEAYPVIGEGTKDCVINAHTGAGKTLAFLAPVIERIRRGDFGEGKGVKVIVLAPGRELCSQITDVANGVVEGTGVKVMMCIGGTGYERTVERFRKGRPDIVVGTPGRVAEMIIGKGGKKGCLKVVDVGVVVMDEADNLLLGNVHKESTVAVMETVKRGRKDVGVIMCSATVRDMGEGVIGRWCREGYKEVGKGGVGKNMREGGELVREEDRDNEDTRMIDGARHITSTTLHGVVKVAREQLKLEILRKILNTTPNPEQVLVFVNEARRVGIVVGKLAEMGIIAAGLHGGDGADKDERVQVAKALRDGRVGCVVSTELAARGIDAVFLTHVINLDLPTDSSHYCHRAGRVGRGGRPGVVVSVASGGKEKGVLGRWGKELGVKVGDVGVREGMMRIVGIE